MKKKRTSTIKPTKTDPIDYVAICEGLTVLVNCFNEMLDSTGERDRLEKRNREKLVQAYFLARNFLPRKTLEEKIGINEKRIKQWATYKKCKTSVLKKCFLNAPQQLTLSEQEKFKRYFTDPENSNLPRNHIWAKARREGLYISRQTFSKYAIAYAGLIEPKERNKDHEGETITARKPFTILHMDSTMVKCSNGERCYIHFIMDNYSRNILGAVPSYSSKSETVAQNLKQVIVKNRLYNRSIKLYCDDGPENHGFIHELMRNDHRIRISQIIGTYIKKSNNLIERWNHKFKHIILKKYKLESFQHLADILPEMIDYNNNLHLPVLHTLTPNEVIKGKKKKDINDAYEVKLAISRRSAENRTLNCEKLCPNVKQAYYGRRHQKEKADTFINLK